MEQMSDNTSENKEYDSDISTVSLGFTKNEEEIVKSIAKTLVGDIPFFNIDNGKVKGSQECPLDSKVSQVLVSNLESKDTLQNTIPDLNISSKPKRNKDLADGARISPARGSLTPSVGDVIIKIENSETSQKLDGNILEGDYEFVEFDDKGLVIETKNGAGILRGRNKREETRVNTAKKESLKYMCKLCGMSSQTPSNLRHHMMMHTGQKPHTCLYCGMTFHQSHLLIEHICTHTGENPLECEVCDETFTTKSALKSHMKVHAEVKGHKCQICHAAFSDKLQLRIHTKKHKDKFYECTDCGDKFITAPRLKRHQMIHTGERPYQCEECGVAFREETTLRAHMGTHLPRGPYPCYLCGKIFSRLNSLSLHKKVHNTNGTYRYVPKKMEPVQNIDNSGNGSVDKNVDTNNYLSEELEVKDRCIPIKENNLRSKSTNASFEEFTCSQNMKTQVMDSCFPTITEPPSDLTRSIMTDVEQEMVSVPHPDIVRDALATGTVLESQGEDGQGYLIVLPKALAEKDYTLIALPPMPASKIAMVSESVVLQENEEQGHNNCDLFVWDNDIDAVTEVAFDPERELLPVEEIYSKAKKQKKEKVVVDEENILQEELHTNKSVKIQKKEKKMKDKKIRIPKSYECQHCGRNCKTSSNYIIHMRTHTGERPYYCDYCGIGFKQLAHLKAHVRIHTGEEPYKCNICDATFKQSSRLKSHQRTQHVEGKVKKKKIAKKFSIRNFYCKICDKTFLDSCYKKQHMRTHEDEAQYKCDRCDAVFKTKSTFKKHRLHHVDNWGICELCGLQFEGVKALNVHKQTSHGRDINDFKKEGHDVNETIKLEGESDHVSSSEEIKENVIESVLNSVNERFKHYQGSHVLSSECTENMTKTKIINASIPADFKQYQCMVCKKYFRQSSNLKTHMRMHTDERPYKCNDCGNAFRQISHLKDHVKMHTGEKPFRCSGCSAAFTQSSAVKYHIRKYHKGKAHVVKEQKNILLQDKESITLENTTQMIDDTIVISIENGVSVSVEHKHFEKSTGALKKEKDKEYKKDISTYSPKIHSYTPNTKILQKCEMCNRSIGKHARHVTVTDNDGRLNICRRCSTRAKSTKLPVLIVRCKEEQNEEESEIHNNQNEEQETIPKESFVKIDRKKICEKTFETIRKSSEPSICNEYKETCFELEDSKKNINHCEENIGNICDMCGKAFGRASALTFHKQMSHRNDYDEEEERLLTNYRSENDDLDNKMKMSEFIKETTVTASSQYQHPCAPLEIKVEAEDISFSEIEYCKCSFCGIKLSDMSMLNKHISQLHPEEISHMKSQADISNRSYSSVNNKCVMQKKRKIWTRKKKTENEGKIMTNRFNDTVGGKEFCLNEISQYKCQGCEKSFTRVAKLKDHINSWCKANKKS
ncbi:zinc finger protein 729-like [Homarus americanus]|uniref:zinc finger protein 729-like n=1 Tax=Homarus americanus TaxID=6706 RepID=UPI001C47F8D6|nr:zinc finger protein 729-like [Homarus americanus]XP_042241190.1 zinc finger protein 729-like [Homarus americanus]XP_042241261.1 zinc finger protein 729-like [Homarus americanus]